MLRLFSSLFRQSLYSGGMSLFIIALVLAISATTALKFSNQQLHHAIEQQAGELLASDMVLSSTQPLDKQWKNLAEQQQLNTSEVVIFNSMASANEQFAMVNVKAVQDNFPLRGALEISPQSSRLNANEIWVSPRILDVLQVKIGDKIQIADAEFTIAGEIVRDANQEIGFAGFSPAVIIRHDDVAQTNAIQAGSRIDYRLLMAGQATDLQQFVQQHKEQWVVPMRLRTAMEGNTRLMRPLQNLERFMQVANILTLILCGIAIAMTCQRYIQQQQAHIALLRCLGASRQQIMMTFFALLTCVGLISTLLGSILGVIFGFGLLKLGMILLPQIELQFSVVQILYFTLPNAFLTCIMVCLGFVLPSILHLAKISPMHVLRQGGFNALTMRKMIFIGIISLTLFTVYLTKNIVLSLSIIGILSVLGMILFFSIASVLKILKKTSLEYWIREPMKMSLQMTALALGLSLMMVLLFVKDDLVHRWQQQLPENTPNQFIYGLPPYDKNALEQQLQQNQWSHTALYPNVRGRLIAKNQQEFNADDIKKHGALSRELNLTQGHQFPENNQVVAGTMTFTEPRQVSVEENIAKELNIQLGDELLFSLPEGNFSAKVISFRKVEWESFSPNFFFFFSPNTFDENAGSYLGSFHLPTGEQAQLTAMIKQFPTTVFVDIQGIFEQVKRILNVITQLVHLLAMLVFIAGLLVLFACLNIMMDERRHEVAVLRAIGISQTQLKRHLSIEMAMIGFGAGLVSIIFAEAISYLVAWRMELNLGLLEQLHWQYWLYLPVLMAILCALIGRYRLRYLCEVSPLLSLRNISSS